jgi:hypothetical protein
MRLESGLRVLTLSGCGAAPGRPNVKTSYSRRGGRADRARNQSALMRAERARIRTGWDFRERQVTVSAKRDSAHQNLLLFGHSSTEIPVRVAP